MKRLFILLSMIISGLGMTSLLSCQDSLFYSEYKDIPNAQWDSRDTIIFQLPNTEYPLDATLLVCVRTRQGSDYKKVVLSVEHLCDDTLLSADTLHLALYDSKGLPLGQAFPFSNYSSRSLPIHVVKDAHHTIRITHIMRQNPLDGVSDVGVFVERK